MTVHHPQTPSTTPVRHTTTSQLTSHGPGQTSSTVLRQVRKRDGRIVAFDPARIAHAARKALEATGVAEAEAISLSVALAVVDELRSEQRPGAGTVAATATGPVIPDVEHIQDVVEKVLMERGQAETAKAYILYRQRRSTAREQQSALMTSLREITFSDARDSDVKRENANVDGNTAMGSMLRFGTESAKQFNLLSVLDPAHAAAHRDGDIHIHDLDFLTLTTTCCQINLSELFRTGFSTGHGHLRSPRSINSYAALACIAIQSNQNDQHGGQAVPDRKSVV